MTPCQEWHRTCITYLTLLSKASSSSNDLDLYPGFKLKENMGRGISGFQWWGSASPLKAAKNTLARGWLLLAQKDASDM